MSTRLNYATAVLSSMLLLSACEPAPKAEAPAESESAISQIKISKAWSRETSEGQDAGGAFMAIANTGTGADRLLGGTTPVAEEVQVHTVDMTGGVMRMRQLKEGLEIPAGGTVMLAPGNFHIMLMRLKHPMKQETTVPVTLQFEKAGELQVELVVQPVGSEGPMGNDHD